VLPQSARVLLRTLSVSIDSILANQAAAQFASHHAVLKGWPFGNIHSTEDSFKSGAFPSILG
jgi:hypothetical protein